MKKAISLIISAVLFAQSMSVYAAIPDNSVQVPAEKPMTDGEVFTDETDFAESDTLPEAETRAEENSEIPELDIAHAAEEPENETDAEDNNAVSEDSDNTSVSSSNNDNSLQNTNAAPMTVSSDSAEDILIDFSSYSPGAILYNWRLANANEEQAVVSAKKTIVMTAVLKEDGQSYDPFFTVILSDRVPAIKYDTVKVGLQWSGTSFGVSPEIYFKTSTHTEWANGDYYQSATPNSAVTSQKTVEFTFDMAEKAGWKDSITELRIDPANTQGTFELEYIRFVSNGNQIIYDANGGISAPRSLTHLENGVYELSTEQPTRNGYEFVGWSLSADGTAADIVKTVTVEDTDVTVYAVWKRKVYSGKSYGFASDFDLDNDFGGWTLSAASFRKKEVSDGVLKLETVVNDARMHKAFGSGAELSSQYCLLKMRYKPISNAHTVILRWQRSVDPYVDNDIVNAHENERVQSLYLPGEANEWHEMTFDLSENTAWNGNIRALWLDVANYWEIRADNPGRIEYDYIRFYRKGENHLNYDANIALAADVSGNSEVTVTNMPENESNVPTGGGYLVSKVVPVASDSSIYFAGWSSSKSSTALVDEEIYVGGNTILYAVWKPKAVSQADFPYKSRYPSGIRRVSEALWKDIAHSKPINTGFETVTDINDIRDNGFNGKRSVVDEAYEGRFALKLKTDTVSDLYPLKELKAKSGASFVSMFAPGEKSKTASASYFIETPLPEEVAETYAMSALSDAEPVNKITLQVKPKYQAKELSFYLRTVSAGGYAMYVKLLGDKNGDGVFACHEDFEPGQWNGVTLDLHQTEQMLPNGMFSGLFVKVNENSEWLFDSVEGEYQKVSQTDLNLEALAKENLAFDGNSLHFAEVDLQKYDVKPVITSAMYDVEGEIVGVDMDSINDIQYSQYSYNVGENLLPNIFEESEWFNTTAEIRTDYDSQQKYYELYDSDSFEINLPELEESLYRLVFTAKKGLDTSWKVSIRLNGIECFAVQPETKFSTYSCIIPITRNIKTISVAALPRMYLSDVRLFKVDPSEMNKLRLFSGIPASNHIKYEDVQRDYSDLPFMDSEPVTGREASSVSYSYENTDYLVLTIINPSCERHATMKVGGKEYTINYGKWDYVFSGVSGNYVFFYSSSVPVLITDIWKYNRFPSNQNNAIDTELDKNYIYSSNCDIIYYSQDNNIFAHNLNTGDVRQITSADSTEKITIGVLSPNGKYLSYNSSVSGNYIYNYDDNTSVAVEHVRAVSNIDNNGNYYGIYTHLSNTYFESNIAPYQLTLKNKVTTIHVKTDGSAAFYSWKKTDDEYLYEVLRNDGEGWYSFKTGNLPINSSIKFFDKNQFKAYFADSCFDPMTGSLSQFDMDNDTLLSITEKGNLLVKNNCQVLLVNPTTKERKLIYTGAVSNPVYYNESNQRLIFTNDQKHVMHYTAKAHANAVKTLLSFDEGTHWQTYQNGRWISVYSDGMEPTAEVFEEYGMTADQLSALSEKDFQSLYENEKEIYTLGIALCVTSESEYNTPNIRNIAVHTTEPDPNRYLYTAKGQTYAKENFARINAIFAGTNVYGADECYYFLCLGNDWVYTYKDGNLLRMKLTAQGLFGNVSGNWLDIRQYGMSDAELRAVPASVLSSLLLNERYANDSFTVAYCIKTEREDTNGISAAFHLVYDPKTADVSGKTVKILLSDQSVLTLSAGDVDESETQRFLLWLETKQAGGKGSPFFKLTAKDRVYYINYYMIKSVEICVE